MRFDVRCGVSALRLVQFIDAVYMTYTHHPPLARGLMHIHMLAAR